MEKSFKKPYKKTVFVPLTIYSWEVSDLNTIGHGFMPYYNDVATLEDEFPECEYLELDIITPDPPSQIFKIFLN